MIRGLLSLNKCNTMTIKKEKINTGWMKKIKEMDLILKKIVSSCCIFLVVILFIIFHPLYFPTCIFKISVENMHPFQISIKHNDN